MLIGLIAAISAAAPVAAAQSLSADIVSAQSIASAQQDAIEQFVKSQAPALSVKDAIRRQKARDMLMEPLQRPRTSPSRAFRLAYSRALAPILEQKARDEHVGLAITALRVASLISTQACYSILEQGLEDPRPAVRYTAARGIGATLQTASDGRAALTPDQIDRAIEHLGDVLANDPDIIVADGASRAFIDATGDLRNRGLTAMCVGMATQFAGRSGAASPDETEINVLLFAMITARGELQTQIASGLDRDFARAAGILGGQGMAYCLRELDAMRNAGETRSADQTALDDLAIVSEVVAALAEQALRRAIVQDKMSQTFRPAMGGDSIQPVRDAVLRWVGAQGRLTKSPYDMPSSKFGL